MAIINCPILDQNKFDTQCQTLPQHSVNLGCSNIEQTNAHVWDLSVVTTIVAKLANYIIIPLRVLHPFPGLDEGSHSTR